MDCKGIIKSWLKQHGFDGLYSEECGCEIEGLFPCDEEGALSCRPGYRKEGRADDYVSGGCSFHIVEVAPSGHKTTAEQDEAYVRAQSDKINELMAEINKLKGA